MTTNLQDYILHSRLFKTFQVDELLFVEYKCLIDEEASDIWAHHNYFAYVLGGQKQWKTRKGEYLVSSGEALFVKKGANAVYQYFEEPFLVLFVFLPDDFIRDTIRKHQVAGKGLSPSARSGDTVLSLSLNEVLKSFFQSLFAYFLEPGEPPAALLKLKMEELILNILHQSDNTAIKAYFLQLGQERQVDLEQTMRTYFHYPLSLTDYARLCARSLSTFRRDFKAVFNTTPAKWLIRERLAYGRFLLETTDKPLQEVVEESGFKNRSHFSRLFKEEYGRPPGRFR